MELLGWFPRLKRFGGVVSALFGGPMATYTAVLLANTSVPSWHEPHLELPFVFAGSAMAAGGGLTGVRVCALSLRRGTGVAPTSIALAPPLRFTAAALLHGDATGAMVIGSWTTAGGRRLAVLGSLVLATLSLAACGNKAGDLTCRAFGQQSTSDRTQTLNDLLSEHSLEVASMGNQLGVSKNVDAFCGSATMLHMPATQNLDRTLNDAVNWDAKQW